MHRSLLFLAPILTSWYTNAMEENVRIIPFDYNTHKESAYSLHDKTLSGYLSPIIFSEKLDPIPRESCEVLVKGSTFIGYIYHLMKKDRGKLIKRIIELAVDPDHQKKGYGKMLLQHAETHATENGCSIIHLSSLRQSMSFYMKCGYSIHTPISDEQCLLTKELIQAPDPNESTSKKRTFDKI